MEEINWEVNQERYNEMVFDTIHVTDMEDAEQELNLKVGYDDIINLRVDDDTLPLHDDDLQEEDEVDGEEDNDEFDDQKITSEEEDDELEEEDDESE
nr:uncharacterized protein LOC112785738 [Arachis hypogaea]